MDWFSKHEKIRPLFKYFLIRVRYLQWNSVDLKPNIAHCCLFLARFCCILGPRRKELRTLEQSEFENCSENSGVAFRQHWAWLALASLSPSTHDSADPRSYLKLSPWCWGVSGDGSAHMSISSAPSSTFSFSPFHIPSLISLVLTHSSVQFSCSVVSDSLRPHGLQYTRPPCPSPTPGVYTKSCPLSRWCHPTISSSIIPFSSCPQSFPASGSFQMSQLFASGSQSIGVSASTSVPPMNTQDWSPSGWTGWISLQSKGLSRVFSNTTVQKHQFFGAQFSL